MPAEEASVFRDAASMSAERGEPWLTRLRPIELISKLTERGFFAGHALITTSCE